MIFLDSNVWLYGLFEETDPIKRTRSAELANSGEVCLSTQVINEVVVNLLRRKRWSEEFLRQLVDDFYSTYLILDVSHEDIIEASLLRERYSFSHWDSLLIAVALRATADVFYSEDMQDGLVVRDSLIIRNPFK